MKHLLLLPLAAATLIAPTTSAKEWFVRQADPTASDTTDGSAEHPLRTINAAAQLARAGDVVTVGPGIYHEWVSPAQAGSATGPIRYRSVPEHAAIVRGTDVLDAKWQPVPDAPGAFTAPLPQAAFVFGNPFVRPPEPSDKQKPNRPTQRHALVFCHDQPLTQATTQAELLQTPNSWLASDDGRELFVHLHDGTAPAAGALEVTTRDRIFAPHRRGLSYIQVEGFVFERCATRPAFPQLGALSTRAGHHWLIRNNVVRDTTGLGIDCGSETWNPESLIATDPQDKHILIAGHNTVEGNFVSNNAQCGIAAWNTDEVRILGNIVSNNAASARAGDGPMTDFEAGGIKVHCFRNGLIEGNLVVSNSSFGIWLDDGWENARVTRNVTLGNCGAGIFVELGFGPVLVDHNFSAANRSLGAPYFGDGIYTHDSSGVTLVHNSFLENAHLGVEQIIVSERVYGPNHVAEASNETLSGNLFYGNRDGAISLPFPSPRSRDNRSDHNAFEPGEDFVINSNNGRIATDAIRNGIRERLQSANLPKSQRPAMAETNRVPKLSLPAWRAAMQMDQHSKPLPDKLRMHLDRDKNLLQVELPSSEAIPATPAGPADDFDLLGQPIKAGAAHAGAIEDLHSGAITVWPLPAVARTPGAQ